MITLLNDLALGIEPVTFTADDIAPHFFANSGKVNELVTFIGLLCLAPMDAIEAQHKTGELDQTATISAQTIYDNIQSIVTMTGFITEDKEVDKDFINKLTHAEGLEEQTLKERLEFINQMIQLFMSWLLVMTEEFWDTIKDNAEALMWNASCASQSRLMKASITKAIGCIK